MFINNEFEENHNSSDKQPYKVKSLAKALSLFGYFSIQEPELGITELSERSGLLKSSISNMVSTFCGYGFLEKNERSGKYRLGSKILELSHVMYQSHDLRTLVHPYLERISAETGENVYLGILSGDEVLYIDSVFPPGSYSARSIIGVKAPLYCTGIGKALLAFMPDSVTQHIIDKGLFRFTPNTLCDPVRLRADLNTIKDRGYAIDDMEHEYGIRCVAVPIRNIGNAVVASMSISGPSLRFTEETIARNASLLLEVQQELRPLIGV